MKSAAVATGVRVEERPCAAGHLGVLILDRPAQLNALSLTMLRALQHQLDAWQDDEAIALVVLTSSSERAFSVGGDARQLLEFADPSLPAEDSATFFSAEYRLDYSLHRYPKPLLCCGQGLILGGGMGLMQGARYRLGTENSHMAMPEARIGLLPDAGASWFLNRLPEGFGRFLGLTGAALNTTDALRLGLLDHAVPAGALPALMSALEETHWGSRIATNDARLDQLLRQFSRDYPASLPQGHLVRHEQMISALCEAGDAGTVVRRILDSPAHSPWWEKAQTDLAHGCPTSPHLLFALLEQGRQMTFGDIFRMELGVATHCIRAPDFREGVSARLIDRNREPYWSFRNVEDVPPENIREFFRSPWLPEAHPLRDL